mmetsp:Transcript_20867/g.40573  ORF Transcript_20867/g.40573 Transcript_20867/m.40573 type:complete len:204 (-) Transcript_20867:40-651(-)
MLDTKHATVSRSRSAGSVHCAACGRKCLKYPPCIAAISRILLGWQHSMGNDTFIMFWPLRSWRPAWRSIRERTLRTIVACEGSWIRTPPFSDAMGDLLDMTFSTRAASSSAIAADSLDESDPKRRPRDPDLFMTPFCIDLSQLLDPFLLASSFSWKNSASSSSDSPSSLKSCAMSTAPTSSRRIVVSLPMLLSLVLLGAWSRR